MNNTESDQSLTDLPCFFINQKPSPHNNNIAEKIFAGSSIYPSETKTKNIEEK
jgi:hypothetical protein